MLFTPLLQSASQGGVAGLLAATQSPNSSAFSGTVAISGTLASTQQPNASAIIANVNSGSSTGTLASTQQSNTASFSAGVLDAGTLAASQQANVASFSASTGGSSGAWGSTAAASTAKIGATVWAPTSLPAGATVHFDASTITPQSDNTTIAAWVDSISGYSASNSNGAKLAKYRTNRVAGKATVQFDGTNWMYFDQTTGANLKTVLDGGNYTIIIAGANVTTPVGVGAIMGSSNGGATNLFLLADGTNLGQYNGGSTGQTYPFSGSGYFTFAITSETASAGNYGGRNIPFQRHYVNGAPFYSNNVVGNPTVENFLTLGAQNSAGNSPGRFDGLNFVIYPFKLTPAQVAQAHVALAQKNNQPLPYGGMTRFEIDDGDSITQGTAVSPATAWPYLNAVARGRKPGQYGMFAIGGQAMFQNTAKFQEIADFLNYIGLPGNITIFEYINSRNNGRNPTVSFQDCLDYIKNIRLKSAWSRVNMGDSTAFDADNTGAPYATNRGVFNSLANDPTTGFAPFCDYFTSLSSDNQIGSSTAYANFPANFAADKVHIAVPGHVFLAADFLTGQIAMDTGVNSFGSFGATGPGSVSALSGGSSLTGSWGSTAKAGTASFIGTVVDPGVDAGTLVATQAPNAMSMSGALAVGGSLAAAQAAATALISGIVANAGTSTGSFVAVQNANVMSASAGLLAAGALAAVQAQSSATMSGLVGNAGFIPSPLRSFRFPSTDVVLAI